MTILSLVFLFLILCVLSSFMEDRKPQDHYL